MGGVLHITVGLALFGGDYVSNGGSHEKADLRRSLRQLRPDDGGAPNGLNVGLAEATRPRTTGTSTHFMQRRATVGRRMLDVSYVQASEHVSCGSAKAGPEERSCKQEVCQGVLRMSRTPRVWATFSLKRHPSPRWLSGRARHS
jgi:hypothetical protein